jgi:hypothetical protein
MLVIDFDRSINRLIVDTDDPTVHFFLETKQRDYQYLPWRKEYGWTEKTIKLYDARVKTDLGGGKFRYRVGVGWLAYLMQVFNNKLSAENYNYLAKEVLMADNYKQTPFKGLRDYQNDDVLYLLKYRFGLVTVNTSYSTARSCHIV